MIEENCVLFVDDEKDVLNALKRQFRKADFKLQTAVGGQAALDLLKTEPIKIIITDERMPGMSGVELLQKVKKTYPDTIRIILSGYADSSTIVNAINMGEVYRFVSKPWNKENLINIIHQSFSQYDLIQRNKNYMIHIVEENKRLHMELDSRNNALMINHEILNNLSHPVLAVTEQNLVELFNDKAHPLLGMQIKPGDPLEKVFSKQVKDKILQGLEVPGGQASFKIEINGRNLTLLIRSLRPNDPYKGLIIIEENCTDNKQGGT